MIASALSLLTVPNLLLAAFALLSLAGAAALLRAFVRWYLGLAAMEKALLRLEERVEYLQETLDQALVEEDEEAEEPPRGPVLPRPGEKDRGLPGPRG